MSLQNAGICAAVVTPVTSQLDPDAEKAAPYYCELLAGGCDALNILGTTGEAMSFSVTQRTTYLERLIALGVPAGSAMAGTGGAALADAIALTRGALDAGYAGALLMPPFFYRGVRGDGVLQFFDAVIAAVDPGPRSIYLYHFPQMSGVAFTAELIGRLLSEFPGVIAGLKDSANDLPYERDLKTRFPELRIFPSSESHVVFARANGMAGCISGSVALWPAQAQTLWSAAQPREEDQQALSALRETVAGPDLIARVREKIAARRADKQWLRTMPPLTVSESAQ